MRPVTFLLKDYRLVLSAIIFLSAIVWQLSEILRGWDHNILALHGFRQCQTAISAFYFIKDGFSVYTKIPVFGPPWIIPIEFPLYQWILAAVTDLSGQPLEQTGRGISLVFHYVSLFLSYRILKLFKVSLPGILFTLTIITLSPLATYWAQGVLIESFSVALTMAFVLAFLTGIESSSRRHLAIAIVIGSIAAVVKITTFAVGWGFLILYVLVHIFGKNVSRTPLHPASNLVWILPFLVPLFFAGAWIYHANSVMATLPIAPNTMSNIEWYFGSIGARFEPDQWLRILKHTVLFSLGGPFPLLIALVPLCIQGVSRIGIALFFLAAISGPLVFWNVYYVHDYYSYEIIFFLCAAVGLCFEGGHKVAGQRLRHVIFGMQLVALLTMLAGYSFTPYQWLLRTDYKADLKQFYEEVGRLVPENDFIVVAGQDWDPTASYTTGRIALMVRWEGWIYKDFFHAAHEEILRQGIKCGGVIIQANNVGQEYQYSILKRFGVDEQASLVFDENLFFYRVP